MIHLTLELLALISRRVHGHWPFPCYVGTDSDGHVVWVGRRIPRSADGLCAIPVGVVEIEDTRDAP